MLLSPPSEGGTPILLVANLGWRLDETVSKSTLSKETHLELTLGAGCPSKPA